LPSTKFLAKTGLGSFTLPPVAGIKVKTEALTLEQIVQRAGLKEP